MKYISLGRDWINNILFNSNLKNNKINKPIGGLWASPYHPKEEYISDWEEFCVESGFLLNTLDKGVIFELKKDARVYTIDEFNDLCFLYCHYKLFDSDSYFELIDFERIAEKYDAILLTEKGQQDTRYTIPSLYGWDVETLLVLNYDAIDEDSFEEYKKNQPS
ncbi:MAG: hypothetical protein ACRC2K_13245 [Clostridium sp.]